MKKITSMIVVLAFVAMLLSSCASLQTNQQKGTAGGAVVGAAIGAILGQAIKGDTEGTLWGAAIGGVVGGIAGNQVGAYMDRQEQALRAVADESEAMSIRRNQDVLTATFKSGLMFDFDSAIIKVGAYSDLDRIARVLNDYPQTVMRVEGHTDAKGTEEYNQRLSERRARAVTNALIHRNVDPRRLTTVGFGESRPVSSNDAANRRVDIVIVPVEAA